MDANKDTAAVVNQLAELLRRLDTIRPTDQADIEAVADARWYLEQARLALLDVGVLPLR